jgi:hypothetical protein
MRRALAAALLAGLVAGSAPGARQALPRATADRPDEVAGPQVHVVYAVPADGADRALDTSGALAASVDAWTRWLAGETGGPRLRLDTSGGELDVTFVRLQRSDAEIAAQGAYVRDELERLLVGAGLVQDTKLYAVYYDGTSTYACGGGAWPPALIGRVAAMYLHGLPAGPVPCDATPLAGPGEPPGYLDIAMLHELVHTLGFVATCAPHHTLNGHVSDSPNDLMWSGDAPWQLPPRLDIGRDDYYGHGRADCPDLARSPFMTSVLPPPPPPLVVAGFSTSTARAGHPFTARLAIRRGDAMPDSAVVDCTLRLRRHKLRVVLRQYASGTAVCTWRLPKSARGRRLVGSVAATSMGETVARAFVVRAR